MATGGGAMLGDASVIGIGFRDLCWSPVLAALECVGVYAALFDQPPDVFCASKPRTPCQPLRSMASLRGLWRTSAQQHQSNSASY